MRKALREEALALWNQYCETGAKSEKEGMIVSQIIVNTSIKEEAQSKIEKYLIGSERLKHLEEHPILEVQMGDAYYSVILY